MNYEVWTWQDIEYRVLEATETLMKLPGDFRGSRGVLGRYSGMYAPEKPKLRIRPSGAAIDRMTTCWGWINALPEQGARELLYAWAWTKVRKGKFLDDFAEREGVSSRTIRREIIKICQRIANSLNNQHIAWVNSGVDGVSEDAPETASQTVSSKPCADRRDYPEARPQHLPESDEHARLIKRLERDSQRRARARRKAQRAA